MTQKTQKKTQKNCWNRWDSNTWWPKSIFAELTVAMKRRNSKNSRKQQKPGNCCQILHIISMPLEPVRVSFPVSGFQVSRNPENIRKCWKTMKTNETKGKKFPNYWCTEHTLTHFISSNNKTIICLNEFKGISLTKPGRDSSCYVLLFLTQNSPSAGMQASCQFSSPGQKGLPQTPWILHPSGAQRTMLRSPASPPSLWQMQILGTLEAWTRWMWNHMTRKIWVTVLSTRAGLHCIQLSKRGMFNVKVLWSLLEKGRLDVNWGHNNVLDIGSSKANLKFMWMLIGNSAGVKSSENCQFSFCRFFLMKNWQKPTKTSKTSQKLETWKCILVSTETISKLECENH